LVRRNQAGQVTDEGGASSIDAGEAFGLVKQPVQAGGPVLMGFDIPDDTNGGGIGGGKDDAGSSITAL
jgi:hypothetical protein